MRDARRRTKLTGSIEAVRPTGVRQRPDRLGRDRSAIEIEQASVSAHEKTLETIEHLVELLILRTVVDDTSTNLDPGV